MTRPPQIWSSSAIALWVGFTGARASRYRRLAAVPTSTWRRRFWMPLFIGTHVPTRLLRLSALNLSTLNSYGWLITVSMRSTLHLSYILIQLRRMRCLILRRSGRFLAALLSPSARKRLCDDVTSARPGREHPPPPTTREARAQPLRHSEVIDAQERVFVAEVADAPLVELPRQPFPPVQIDLNLEGKPALEPYVHEPELGVDQVEVEVEAPPLAGNDPSLDAGEGVGHLQRREYAHQTLRDAVSLRDRSGEIVLPAHDPLLVDEWTPRLAKAGNRHARRLLIEASWHYRHHPSTLSLRKRREGQPARIVAIADRAMLRLHRRFNRMLERGKPRPKVVVAVARELTGFIWAAMRNHAA